MSEDIAQKTPQQHKIPIIKLKHKSSLSKKCHTQSTSLQFPTSIQNPPTQSPSNTIKNISRIGELLKFHQIQKRSTRVETQPSKINRKITINPISHISKIMHLPSATPQHHPSDAYFQYSDLSQRNHSKFTKPQGYFSKFSDNVEKNKALLRRGVCQIPLALFGDESQMKTTKNKADSRKYSQQYSSYKQKIQTNISKKSNYNSTQPSEDSYYPRLNPQKNFTPVTPIRKNMDSYVHEYNQLSKSERWVHGDNVKLSNCMNRILGGQMVKYWMLGQSRHLKLFKKEKQSQENAQK